MMKKLNSYKILINKILINQILMIFIIHIILLMNIIRNLMMINLRKNQIHYILFMNIQNIKQKLINLIN